MNKTIRAYFLFGGCTVSFCYAFTSPIIQIYFMRLVEPSILALANLLTLGLAAIVTSSIPNEKIKNFYRGHFNFIVVTDVICFFIISFLSVEYVTVRFLGFSVMSAISSNLWMTIIKDAINRIMSGKDLTNFTSFCQSFELWFSLAGGILAMIFTTLDVSTCIAIQCVANLIMGITDMHSYKMMSEINERNNRQEERSQEGGDDKI